jgi:hypothetical protein
VLLIYFWVVFLSFSWNSMLGICPVPLIDLVLYISAWLLSSCLTFIDTVTISTLGVTYYTTGFLKKDFMFGLQRVFMSLVLFSEFKPLLLC